MKNSFFLSLLQRISNLFGIFIILFSVFLKKKYSSLQTFLSSGKGFLFKQAFPIIISSDVGPEASFLINISFDSDI
jgi:hypothetical protein